MADAEVDGSVELRIVELLDHVGADDACLRSAERDERRDVESAHADDPHVGILAGEGKRPAGLVVEVRFRHDAGARHHRQGLVEDAAFRHGEGQCWGERRGHGAGI